MRMPCLRIREKVRLCTIWNHLPNIEPSHIDRIKSPEVFEDLLMGVNSSK